MAVICVHHCDGLVVCSIGVFESANQLLLTVDIGEEPHQGSYSAQEAVRCWCW